MVMGSRTIDFMNPNLTDHGVEGFLIEPLDEIEDPYHLYHDFGRNENPLQICDSVLNKSESDADKDVEQTSSPGIILIVEAEGVTADLSNQTMLKDKITSFLQKDGFPVLSTVASESDDGNPIILFVLKDGYIVARSMPQYNYCGFDIHFWSNLDKHENAKHALIAAVGSDKSSVSAFRVIAGGMFGLSSWQEDEKIRGPQFETICSQLKKQQNDNGSRSAKEAVKTTMDLTDIVDDALVESLKLIDGQDKKIVMLVGDDEVTNQIEKKHIDVLNNLEDVDQVHLLNCPAMQKFNEYKKDALNAAISCEKQLKASLEELSEDKKFDVLIIGATANMRTASILLKAFSGQHNNPLATRTAFEPNVLIVSTSPTDTGAVDAYSDQQQWHGPLVQLFKNDIFIDEPATYSEIAIRHANNGDGINLLLANSGDDHFIQRLNNTMVTFQEKSGYIVEFQMVDGGRYLMQEDFIPTHHFLPDDYDQRLPLEQWKSQQPLGHQIIFQMEQDGRKSKRRPLSAKVLRASLEHAISKTSFPGLILDSIDNDIAKIPGDGCMLVAIWPGGSIIVLWDGRAHVDVNLFTYQQDFDKANAFDSHFRSGTALLTTLRDEQPRGVGRVVSYFSDLRGDEMPHWS